MAQFEMEPKELDTNDTSTIMKQVKFLVSGWTFQPDGSYHIYKTLCDFEQAQSYLRLAAMRDDTILIKVDNIEVVWNAD